MNGLPTCGSNMNTSCHTDLLQEARLLFLGCNLGYFLDPRFVNTFLKAQQRASYLVHVHRNRPGRFVLIKMAPTSTANCLADAFFA